MARRLTVFSKFLITLGILSGLVFGGRYFLTETETGRNLLRDSGYSLPEFSADELMEQLNGGDQQSPSPGAAGENESINEFSGFYRPGVVYFEENKDKLTINGMALVDLHYSSSGKKSKSFKVLVEGHTDKREESEENKDLALNRARRVADYLKTAHGLGSDQVAILSIGAEKPAGGCEGLAAEDCRARNRRVEIQLLSK